MIDLSTRCLLSMSLVLAAVGIADAFGDVQSM